MDYEALFSSNVGAEFEMPPGLKAPTKYVFSVTYADPSSLSTRWLSEAMQEAVSREGIDLAPYPPPQGHVGMRELICRNLEERRGLAVDVDSIFLTGGAAGAIQSILDALVEPGDVVLVEEFCYLGTIRMLLQRRAQVVHVPTDDQGMQTDALESTIRNLQSGVRRPKLIYTIPVYQNPMGMTLSLERRLHMVEISQKYHVPILENESYADFRIDGPALPHTMMGIDDQDSVMYVSAYTKLIGCGLRLGYGAAPKAMMTKLAGTDFGPSPSHLAAITVHEYLRNHMDEHVDRVSESLRAKREAMLAALEEHFPPSCSWNRPNGGMMVWVRLPEGGDTWTALDKAVEADVKYNPGPVFRADRGGANYLRLTYSHNSPDEIRDGIAILAEVFHREGLFDPKGLHQPAPGR